MSQRSQASQSCFSSVLSGVSKCLQFSLRAGAERVVSPAAGRCTAEADADAGSVWSCADADADADAAIGSASSSSERVTPQTDEHSC